MKCERGNDEDGDPDPNRPDFYYMCVNQGNSGNRRKTMCVNEKQIAKRQQWGAECGCCNNEDGTVSDASCPEMCGDAADECGTTDDGDKKYYMCRTQGNRERTQCIPEKATLRKQLMGFATCGCCEDGDGNCILPGISGGLFDEEDEDV